jgi:hypothetical protein
MSDLMSTQPYPIKVNNLVPGNIRANEKAIENVKTVKVTTLVTLVHIFGETNCNSHNTNARMSA